MEILEKYDLIENDFDILSKEYGVDETNISKAIPFDIPSLLTSQDKFDILLHFLKLSVFFSIIIIHT